MPVHAFLSKCDQTMLPFETFKKKQGRDPYLLSNLWVARVTFPSSRGFPSTVLWLTFVSQAWFPWALAIHFCLKLCILRQAHDVKCHLKRK